MYVGVCLCVFWEGVKRGRSEEVFSSAHQPALEGGREGREGGRVTASEPTEEVSSFQRDQKIVSIKRCALAN